MTGLYFSDCRYLLTACAELLLARLIFRTVSIDRILVGFQPRTSAVEKRLSPPESPVDVERVGWALAAAASRVPWRSDCMIQALAANNWLRRYNFDTEFYLGATKDASGELLAHAWLRCGGATVVGGHHEEFSVIIGPSSRADCARQKNG